MRKTAQLLMFLLLLSATGMAMAQTQKLNLQQASMQTLITTVGEITGKNFVIDPQVQGTVNVVSSRAMTPDQIYELFLSVLKVHGYAAVPAGEYVKIVPDTVARQDTIPTLGQNEGRLADDALVTRVIEVKHVPAAELISLLRPLVPQNGYIQAHPSSNLLVLSDRAGNVARLQRIIERIDTVSEDDIEVIPLRHAHATEIVRMLNTLAQGGGQQAANSTIADERTNSVLIAGDPSRRLRLKTIIMHLDTPLDSGQSTQVIGLQYASADALLPILESVLRSLTGQTPASGEDSTYIQAHAETNSIIISAPPAVFRELAAIVRQLDIRRQQVMVEAIIAEVADDTARELGVQWQASGIDDINDSGIIGGTNFPTNFGQGPGVLGLGVGGDNGLAVLGGLGAGLNLGYLSGTIQVGDQQIAQIGALLRALDASAGTNVLSTPNIVTLDHQEALINVGQEVPFITGQFTNTGSGNNNGAVNPFQTIDRRDVGLTLTVTPHINRGDTITMDIVQKVSSLSSQAVAVDLITNKREFSTTVMVTDGGILVLGGLIDETVDESVQKVPGLGDIPVVGNLFRFRSAQKTKRNLMVFIRPRILRDAAGVRAVTQSRYDAIRQRQIEVRQTYQGALPPEQLPLLPQLEDYLRATQPATDRQ